MEGRNLSEQIRNSQGKSLAGVPVLKRNSELLNCSRNLKMELISEAWSTKQRGRSAEEIINISNLSRNCIQAALDL